MLVSQLSWDPCSLQAPSWTYLSPIYPGIIGGKQLFPLSLSGAQSVGYSSLDIRNQHADNFRDLKSIKSLAY